MHNEFTAIVEQDGPWYIAYCAEVPGANGQGKTRDDCLANLREAIASILEHRREESCMPASNRSHTSATECVSKHSPASLSDRNFGRGIFAGGSFFFI
jgi:predicted RNase H-like HicB family nuclease